MSARNILEQELEAANAVAPDYDLSKGFDSLGITEEDLTNRINPTTNAYARDENPFTARSRFGRISSVPYGYEPSEGKKVEQKFDPSSITPGQKSTKELGDRFYMILLLRILSYCSTIKTTYQKNLKNTIRCFKKVMWLLQKQSGALQFTQVLHTV